MAKLLTEETTAIWRAQGKCCAICGELMLPVSRYHPTRGWTIEHVYPRRLKRYWHEGNKLVTHVCCNNDKGGRMPTGCEIVMLHAVNAQLGLELTEREHEYHEELRNPVLAIALRRAFVR